MSPIRAVARFHWVSEQRWSREESALSSLFWGPVGTDFSGVVPAATEDGAANGAAIVVSRLTWVNERKRKETKGKRDGSGPEGLTRLAGCRHNADHW